MDMIKIFIIEDHLVTIAGLRTFFRPSRDEIIIAKTATSIEDALLVEDLDSFNVILLDLWLPMGEPIENFQQIEKKFPGIPIVIYTSEESIHWQRKMYNLGAKAFINKKADKTMIESILRRVAKGETVFSSVINEFQTKMIVESYKNPRYGLSGEQEEIIHWFLEGFSTKEIAGKLGKDVSTINKGMKRIRKIFEVSNNVDLIKTILNIKLE